MREFQQKINPSEHLEQLRREVAASPEKAKEILQRHWEMKPEQMYGKEYQLQSQQISELEKRIMDPAYQGKEGVMTELFTIAEEKGLLNAAKVAKNLPISFLDEFHDRLITILNGTGNFK